MRWLIVLLLLPIISTSQSQIDGDKFLSLAKDFIGFSEAQSSYKSVGSSIIDEVDLRTETSDFELDRQEYTLRVKPNTPKKMKAQKELSEHILNAFDFDELEWRCDLIKSFHEDWLSLYIKTNELDLNNRLLSILKDKTTVLNRKHASLDFDFEEIIRMEKEKSELLFVIDRIQLDVQRIKSSYDLNPSEALNFSNFIGIEQLESIVSEVSTSMSSNKEDEYEKELIQKEIKLEEAEKKQIIDFAQIRYDGPHNDLLRERISLGLAFTLNTSKSRDHKIEELNLELRNLENKGKRESTEKILEYNKLRASLLDDIRSLKNYKDIHQKEKNSLNSIKTALNKKVGYDPLILLDIEERTVKIELDEWRQLEDIFSDYIDLSREDEKLCNTDKNILVSLN